MDLFQPCDGCEIIGLKFVSGETCFDISDRCELMDSFCYGKWEFVLLGTQ